jgi:hypothetical protein
MPSRDPYHIKTIPITADIAATVSSQVTVIISAHDSIYLPDCTCLYLQRRLTVDAAILVCLNHIAVGIQGSVRILTNV